ncbi:MAG: sodium:calcium antiporter [Deltaproteobacteria bacterium]|nr:sodium:calcium antiporter [Deltaproteobacteria bacterium]
MTPTLVFFASGILLVLSAVALARYADAIAENTKIGRIWVGTILLAGATSLPELITDSSAIYFNAPNLALGDLFGSSMANMLILAIIDLMSPKKKVLHSAAFDHVLTAGLALALTALAAIFILLQYELSIARISIGSLVVFLVYAGGNRSIYLHSLFRAKNNEHKAPQILSKSKLSLKRALFGFTLVAVMIAISAPIFAWSAKEIAAITGLGNTFVGTWLVGFATSLPELATSLAAVKMGALDLAVGNLFGSNAINMALLLPLDILQGGNLFALADPDHVITALFAVVLMSIGLAAIIYRAEKSTILFEPGSQLMLLIYLAALGILYFKAVPL